jgi:hypothetical protein
MGHDRMVQDCDHAISDLLPDLPRPEQKALAGLVAGVVVKETINLSKASALMPGAATRPSKERRAQRLLANPNFRVYRAQRRLLERVLRRCHGRIDLLVDATTTGATAHQPGTATVLVAIGSHGRAIPLLWRSWRTNQKGQNWRRTIAAMLKAVASLLPADVDVVVMTDRGLTGSPIVSAIRTQGWHFLLRAKANVLLRWPQESAATLGELVPRPGTSRMVRDGRIWAPPPTSHKAGQLARWDEAVQTNIVAVWRAQDKEPWLVITDLPATTERCREYRHRTWEEELFRDLKGGGWGWEHSKVKHPHRVQRLLFVLALATVWVLALGQRVIRQGKRCVLEVRCRRRYSRFQLGVRWVEWLRDHEQPVPCVFHLWLERPHVKTVM